MKCPLILGFDDRYDTWFAQLYAAGEAGRDRPVWVCGYTREEAAVAFRPPLPKLGPERVKTFDDARALLHLRGVFLR